jgi:hypothetical protein
MWTQVYYPYGVKGRRGCDRIVVEFTITYALMLW